MSVAKNLDTLLPPARQTRSQETFQRVLDTFTEMLNEVPFDQITIAELSRRSRTSPPSIYARFADKSALLLAAHETYLRAIDEKSSTVFSGHEDPSVNIAAITENLCDMYAVNRNLLRSVLLSDNVVLYSRVTLRINRFGDGLCEYFARIHPDAESVATEEAARRATSC